MTAGLYRAGDSPMHRAPAWLKLIGLLTLTTLLVVVRSPLSLAIGATLVILLYAVARFGPATLAAQLRPLRWIVLVLTPFQWWTAGPRAAVVIVGTLLVTVAAAALLTVTTRVSDLLEVFTVALRPLRPLGVDVDRIAFTLALAIRSVPHLLVLAGRAQDARRARGLEGSPRALLVPFVVRAVRHAHATGDALAARGYDD